MKILYFSWLREKIGLDSEEIKISEKNKLPYCSKDNENNFIKVLRTAKAYSTYAVRNVPCNYLCSLIMFTSRK